MAKKGEILLRVWDQVTDEPITLDIFENISIATTFQFSNIQDWAKTHSSFSQSFRLPGSTKNNNFFGQAYDINVTIDTNNYEAMAKAMGKEGEGTKSSDTKKTQQLPRFRINHSAIMGETKMNGKNVNVEVVEGGTYKLEIPDGDTYYSKTAKIRPFMQRYMYKRFVKNMNAKMGEPMGIYHKTVMADSLNLDLKDNQGGFNCGKPAGYIQDFKALPRRLKT